MSLKTIEIIVGLILLAALFAAWIGMAGAGSPEAQWFVCEVVGYSKPCD